MSLGALGDPERLNFFGLSDAVAVVTASPWQNVMFAGVIIILFILVITFRRWRRWIIIIILGVIIIAPVTARTAA